MILRRGGAWYQRWRVPLGFACAALFIAFSRPEWPTLSIGGVIAVGGLALRAWAAGHIRKNKDLAVSGPYAYSRNPLYLGSFILGLGFTVASGRLVLGILFTVLFVGIYLPVMRVEAGDLTSLFGARYTRYAAAVPLFFPRLTPFREAGSSDGPHAGFDPGLYLRYREYRAAIGLVLAWTVLALRILLPPLR